MSFFLEPSPDIQAISTTAVTSVIAMEISKKVSTLVNKLITTATLIAVPNVTIRKWENQAIIMKSLKTPNHQTLVRNRKILSLKTPC
jgi:hypothetical protein